MRPCLIHDGILMGPTLCKFCAYHHGCREFLSSIAMSCSEDFMSISNLKYSILMPRHCQIIFVHTSIPCTIFYMKMILHECLLKRTKNDTIGFMESEGTSYYLHHSTQHTFGTYGNTLLVASGTENYQIHCPSN